MINSPVQRVDTVRVLTDAAYIELLERINQQQALLASWAGWAVAALGVLFAVGAVVAALVLFRQSSEYRRQVDRFARNASTAVQELLHENQARIDVLIQDLRSRADEGLADIIAQLERDKTSMREKAERFEVSQTATVPFEFGPDGSARASTIEGFVCPTCAAEWREERVRAEPRVTVTCPKGHVVPVVRARRSVIESSWVRT